MSSSCVLLLLVLFVAENYAFYQTRRGFARHAKVQARPSLKDVERELKLRPPYPNAGAQTSLTFRDYLELVRLNVSSSKAQSSSSSRSIPPTKLQIKKYEIQSITELVQMVQAGVRKGHKRRAYEVETLVPAIGVGAFAALLFVSQNAGMNAVRPSPAVPSVEAVTSASPTVTVAATASFSDVANAIDLPEQLSSPSMSAPDMASLESRVMASAASQIEQLKPNGIALGSAIDKALSRLADPVSITSAVADITNKFDNSAVKLSSGISSLLTSTVDTTAAATSTASQLIAELPSSIDLVADTVLAKLAAADSGVTGYLDANPDLRLSTSEYVSKFMTREVRPVLEQGLARLTSGIDASVNDYMSDRPELRRDLAGSTSDYLAKYVQPFLRQSYETLGRRSVELVQRSKAYGANLATTVADNWAKQAEIGLRAGASATYTIADTLQSSTQQEASAAASKVLEALAPTVDALQEVSNAALVKASAVIDLAPSAVARATSTLAEELGAAGLKLGSNVAEGVTRTGQAVGRVSAQTLSALDRPADVPVPPSPTQLYTLATTSTSPPRPSYTEALSAQLSAVAERAKGWRLFSDADHWRNGFWERQLVAASEVKEEDVLAALSKLESRAEAAVAAAGKQAEETVVALNDALNQVPASVDALSEQVQRSSEKLIADSEEYAREAATSLVGLEESLSSALVAKVDEAGKSIQRSVDSTPLSSLSVSELPSVPGIDSSVFNKPALQVKSLLRAAGEALVRLAESIWPDDVRGKI